MFSCKRSVGCTAQCSSEQLRPAAWQLLWKCVSGACDGCYTPEQGGQQQLQHKLTSSASSLAQPHPILPPRRHPLQIKEQVQLVQGVSALIARLDVGGLLHYGNSTENSM